jgi:hypothetical protein
MRKTLIVLIKSLLNKPDDQQNKMFLANNAFKTAFITCCLLLKSQIKSQISRTEFFRSDVELNVGSNFVSRSFLKKLLKVSVNHDEFLSYLADLKLSYDIEFKLNSNRILKLFNLINVKKQISLYHPMSTLSNKKQFKVFVTQPIPSEALQILQENNLDNTINTKTPLDRETLLKSVQNVDALFCTLNEKINVE